MAKQHINIGDVANDRTGDPLRTAFTKVNANFDELYSTDVSTKYHLGDDVQFVDVDPVSGAITIQSGYNTGMPVYIKGANCAAEGVGGNVVIEAGAPPLAAGGPLYNGTVGNIEMAANQTSIDSNGSVWTFKDDGSLETPNGQTIVSDAENIVLQAQNGAGFLVGEQGWLFDSAGKINVPSLFPRTFTAVLDTGHMSYPNPSVALVGEPWQMDVTFAIVDGQLETQVQQIFPILNNPGYVTGYTFGFTFEDHGIPGYGFTIELGDVVHPGGAGWTSNIAVSQAPALPPSITSQQTLLLHGDNSVVISNGTSIHEEQFRFEGRKLYIPQSGDIVDYLGNTVLGGNTGTIWTNNANGCLRVELASTGFQAYTSASHVDLQDGGQWNIGSNQNSTSIGNDQFSNLHDLSMRSGDATYITTNLRENGNYQWTFGADATLSLPECGAVGAAVIQPNATTFGIKLISNSNAWAFGTDAGLTLPGELHGPAVIDPFEHSLSGYTLNITPSSDLSSKKFGFRIDQYAGPGVFTRAYLDMPQAETDKQVGISFPHTDGTVGYIFNQGANTNDDGLNNAFNIFYNSGDIKITAENGNNGDGPIFNTWRFGVDNTLSLSTDGTTSNISAPDNLLLYVGGARWAFSNDGRMTFPEGYEFSNITGSAIFSDVAFNGSYNSLLDLPIVAPNLVNAGPTSNRDYYYQNAGDSLAGWTVEVNLGSITIDGTTGHPGSSIKFVHENNNIHANFSGTWQNRTIEFDVMFDTNADFGLVFGADSGGVGDGVSLRLRQGGGGTQSGLGQSQNWLYTGDGPDTNIFTDMTWYTVKVVIGDGSLGSISYYINGMLAGNNTAYTLGSNTYWGFVTNAGNVWIDNIKVYNEITTAAPTFRRLVAADLPSIDANTLTGTTLPVNVTGSSLTSVGQLTGLVVGPGQLHVHNEDESYDMDTGALQVVGGANIGKNLIAQGTIYAGKDAYSEALTNPLIVASSPANVEGGYSQVAILNNTAEASGDYQVFVDGYDITGDAGDTGWSDLGYAGSNFNDPRYTITRPGDGYVLVSGLDGSTNGGNLVLGTDSTGQTNDIVFGTGGFHTSNEKMRLRNVDGSLHIKSGLLDSDTDIVIKSGTTRYWPITVNALSNNGTEIHVPKAAHPDIGNQVYVGYPVFAHWAPLYAYVTNITSSPTGPMGAEWIFTLDQNFSIGFVAGDYVTFGTQEGAWTFSAGGGSLTLPQYGANISQADEETTIDSGGAYDLGLQVDTGKTIYVRVGSAEWSFGNAGGFDDNVLKLPVGGDIVDSTGTSVFASTYTLPTATDATLGGVIVDGSTIVIVDGVISATGGGGGGGYSLPTAGTGTLGGVKIDGTTITINNGTISAVIPTNISAFTNNAGYLTSVTTISGNAGTATKLATARNINGVAFDGTGDITVTAAASTLTGNTLNAGITGSSLTSVGTLANLTVTNAIVGSVTGSAGSVAASALTGNTLASGVTTSSLTSVGTLANLTVTNTITGSVSGNAGTVTNGVVSTGSYANPSWITSLAYSKLTGAPNLASYATSTQVSTLQISVNSLSTSVTSLANGIVTTVTKTGLPLAQLGQQRVATLSCSPANNGNWHTPGLSEQITVTLGATTVVLTLFVDEGGNITANVVSATTGSVSVGQNVTINGQHGGNDYDANPVTVTVATVSGAPTSIDLTKAVNELTDGAYTLDNGTEGQLLYLTTQYTVTNSATIQVSVSNFRTTGTVSGNYSYTLYPFVNSTGTCRLIFSNGSWQSNNLPSTIVANLTGNVTGNVTGSLTGNASTATSAATLTTARNINGTAFNGSANITVSAAAGTLTGGTLNATVLASSLTSVGTLTNLTVGGSITRTGTTSAASWGTNGIFLKIANATVTDTSSSGTLAAEYMNIIGAPQLTFTSATTVTNAANLYIASVTAGSNATLTNNWSLITQGDVRVDGNLYMPNRPAFRVYGAGTTNNLSTTQNTSGILNSNNWAVDFQQGSALSGSTGVFTVPITGLYNIHLVARVSSNTDPASQVSVIKNYATTNVTLVMWEHGANPTVNHYGVSTIAKLTAGDTLVVRVTQGTINFDANDNWSVAFIG